MPRYFFHRADGEFDPDDTGTELPDLTAARTAAIRFAAESVKDSPGRVQPSHAFRVEVSDDAGMLLCTIVVLELDAPATRGLREPRRQG